LYIAVIILHVIVCALLVLIVLLQRGKGADMGAVFGGSSSTIFGSAGPGTFLSKITTAVALVFMLTSLYLAYFSANKGRSVIESPAKTSAERTVPQGSPSPQTGVPESAPAASPQNPAGQAVPAGGTAGQNR
jgi:preprotein translocase subunit SecG